MSDPTDLVARARSIHVVVIGAGIAGLVAARACARVGFTVTLIEAGARVGGCLAATELAGVRVDAVADSSVGTETVLTELIDDLGLADAVVPDAGATEWISGLPGAHPIPVETVAGIPANPWAEDVRRFIGWRGAWRAYLDRLRPPLTIGHERNLGALVRRRMGDRVVDRLLTPLARGRYGVLPDQVDVDVAAPGLNNAFTRHGNLAAAVSELAAGNAGTAARWSLRDGMFTLADALVAQLGDLDVDVRTGTRVTRLEREGAGWIVHVDAAGSEDPDDHAPVAATSVIVATARGAATALLDTAGVDVTAAADLEAPSLDVVTLLVESAALDAAPRGRAVYPVAGAATAVVHATASWPALADAVGPGRHVLRVSLPVTAARGADEAVDLAARAAAEALGVPLPPAQVIAAHRERVDPGLPASVLDHDARVAGVRSAVAAGGELAVVGAWIGGSGLAAAAADASAEADRVRHRLLWGAERTTSGE